MAPRIAAMQPLQFVQRKGQIRFSKYTSKEKAKFKKKTYYY